MSSAALAPTRNLATPANSPTILIIEDYPDTRELISVLLVGQGYHVIEAEGGVEGLLKATAMYPDLVIMDLSLPEMDGVEAARRIHEQAKLSRIPIIVVSAYLTEEVMADAKAAGCVAVFRKPFDTYELLATISRTLENAIIENSSTEGAEIVAGDFSEA